MQYAWKRRSDGSLITHRVVPSLEELYKNSSFGLPVREVSDYQAVTVVQQNGKWIEMSEKDWIWQTIVGASSR